MLLKSVHVGLKAVVVIVVVDGNLLVVVGIMHEGLQDAPQLVVIIAPFT